MDNKTGIFDIKRENINPLNGKIYSDEAKKLGEKLISYPMFERANEFLESINKNRVTLVAAGTGVGKSLICPILVSHYYNYSEKIAMSMPKQMITQSMAEYIAKIMDVDLGKEIGYKYKGAPNKSASDATKILYATDGTIVNKLLNNEKIPEYKCVIIDEAHERKVQIDFMLYLLRRTLSLRDDFKLVIMSATIDVNIFKRYFNSYSFGLLDVASKSNYEVKPIWTPKPVDDYIEESFRIIKQIVKNGKEGDILVFVTSVKETEEMCQQISNDSALKDLFCVELYSGLSDFNQELAKNKNLYKTKNSEKKRKIVIATEVAESSITIDGIIYVIDNGKALIGGYDPVRRARTLEKGFITQSQIKQRRGRAGRTEPGVCYHLYTEEQYNKLIEFPEPTIRKSNITDECLKLLNISSINNISNLIRTFVDFIEPPRDNYITSALLQLNELGLTVKGDISPLGKIVSEIRTNCIMAVVMLKAAEFGVLKEVTKTVALINASKGIFNNIFISFDDNNDEQSTESDSPNNKKDHNSGIKLKLDKSKKGFADEYGDFISMYKIYTKAEIADLSKKLPDWCYKHFIKMSTMDKAFKEYKKLYHNMRHIIKHNNINTDIEKVKHISIKDRIQLSFQLALPMNIGKLDKNGYKIEFSKMPVQISKESLIKKDPKKIFYGEYSFVMGSEKLSMVGKRLEN